MDDFRTPPTSTADTEWLINSVAHALRNTLFAALLKAEMLARSTGSREAQGLYDTLRNLERLVDEMLLFGRPTQLEPGPVEVDRLLHRLAECYGRGERVEPARVEVRIAEPGITAIWDADAVRTSLERILDNAVQHTPPPHAVELVAARTGEQVTITVTDRGPGIDPSIRDRVFEPFFPQHEGRPGLGLAVARKLVRACGGEVTLDSAPGRGTTVTVTLPLRTPS